MRASWVLCLACTVTAASTGVSAAADWPPQDHGGADFAPAHGDRVWGLHTGVAVFRVDAATTVAVKAFDGSTTGATGMFEVFADSITIAGVLDATGCGYSGGGGGGGGGGADCYSSVLPATGSGGAGGNGTYPATALSGQRGRAATFIFVPGGPDSAYPGEGGAGAAGDGPQHGTPGAVADGGYAAPGANGDVSADASTLMGSGGAGGAGATGSCGNVGGGGGGGGGCGGGNLRLTAQTSFLLRAGGRIVADGALGGNGATPIYLFGNNTGGAGGHSAPAKSGSGATFGGKGAGGGILVQTGPAASATFEAGGLIRSLGANANAGNGGTVKVIHGSAVPPAIPVGTVVAGRTLVAPAPAGVARWADY